MNSNITSKRLNNIFNIKNLIIIIVTLLFLGQLQRLNAQDYNPNKVDFNYHHAPKEAVQKWKDLKFGMRVHFGVYSLLGVGESWCLVGSSPEFKKIYNTLYQVFNPTSFNADKWAQLAEDAGMKYIVFTAKHADGFSMFNTKTKIKSLWRIPTRQAGENGGIGNVKDTLIHYSIMNTPYKKDITLELAKAFRKKGLGFGLYYSNADWIDPGQRFLRENIYYDPSYKIKDHPKEWEKSFNRQYAQLKELCTNYGNLLQIGFDAGWPKQAWSYMKKIIKMVRKFQPDALFRQRGLGAYGDYQTPEHWVPAGPSDPRLHKPWQAIEQIGTNWSYWPYDNYKSKAWILETLIDVVAKGGNFMLGIAPMGNGWFPKQTIERIKWVGRWLKVNGGAIYKTRPYKIYKDGKNIWFTRSKDTRHVYAIVKGTLSDEVKINNVLPKKGSEIKMLGEPGALKWSERGSTTIIKIPDNIRENPPSKFARVFKIKITPYLQIPKISPYGGHSIGKPFRVKIFKMDKNEELRYTIDGSEPDNSSTLYTKPILIKKSVVLKVKGFEKGYTASLINSVNFTILNKNKNGLKFKYYEGYWKKVPDFQKLTPIKSGHIYDLNLKNINHREDHFAIQYNGFIKIPSAGKYTFYLKSDDGSKLYIDDKQIVDNDGSHGPKEKSGQINLTSGKHSLRIGYFEDYAGQMLELSYSGPGIKKESVPDSDYYIK